MQTASHASASLDAPHAAPEVQLETQAQVQQGPETHAPVEQAQVPRQGLDAQALVGQAALGGLTSGRLASCCASKPWLLRAGGLTRKKML